MSDEKWVYVESNVSKEMVEVAPPALADVLRKLLANNVIVYFRAHGYHWNVKGIHFPAYHEFFQEIYEDVYSSIDDTAEWLRKEGYDAPYTIQDFMALTDIQEPIKQVSLTGMLQSLLEGIQNLEATTEEAFKIATDEDEQVLINFLGGRLDMLEKWEWQLNTSVNEGWM